MARARLVTADTSSEEVDQLRRTVNTLLLMLETAEASLTAGASAEDVLNAWADAIRTGTEDNPESIANVVSTGRELVGLRPSPTHPQRPRNQTTQTMTADSDF
jgi:hypothetical protein